MASLRASPAPGPLAPTTLRLRAVAALAAQAAPAPKQARLDSERPWPRGAVALTTGLAAAVAGSATGRSRWSRGRRAQRLPTRRWAYCTGPGWVDEVARILDPRPEGPEWEADLGYRGRRKLRLLLDGEDLVHSYAKARFEQTGKWTGPLSAGIEQALMYGAWRGSDMEDETNMTPDEKGIIMESPEIMSFVGIPVDLIQSVKKGNVVDGYPEDTRVELDRCLFGEDGLFVNDWIRQLQEINRLITWTRLNHPDVGRNALITQKYWEDRPVRLVRNSRATVLLSQVMGAGTALGLGDKVDALKPGRFINGTWLPDKWEEAQVMAVNYDGTYDLQFHFPYGPYHKRVEQERKLMIPGLTKPITMKKVPHLPKGKHMRYYGSGASDMPAQFELMLEMNFAQGVSPENIRLLRSAERLSDTTVDEGNQDWYLVTNAQFVATRRNNNFVKDRVSTFSDQFIIQYKWVETADGDLRFEPVPSEKMALALKTTHKKTAKQFAVADAADVEDRRILAEIRAAMDAAISDADRSTLLTLEDELPTRPAGPLTHYKTRPISTGV